MGKKSLYNMAIAMVVFTILIATNILPIVSGISSEINTHEISCQKSIEKNDDVDVTFYSFGLDEQSINEIQMSSDEVELLLNYISEYSVNLNPLLELYEHIF